MPIEPVKIPQNVYVEDRIVGPVTLRQLIILLITGGFSYALWTGAKNQLGVAGLPVTVLCWVPLLIGAAFAFVRVQQISLMRFILLALEKMEKPAIRTWAPRRGISINFQFFSAAAEAAQKARRAAAPHPHREKLEELSALLDAGPTAAEHREEVSLPPEEYRSIAPSPVNPNRVRACAIQGASALDDILERTDPSRPPFATRQTSPSATTLHDILPPQS